MFCLNSQQSLAHGSNFFIDQEAFIDGEHATIRRFLLTTTRSILVKNKVMTVLENPKLCQIVRTVEIPLIVACCFQFFNSVQDHGYAISKSSHTLNFTTFMVCWCGIDQIWPADWTIMAQNKHQLKVCLRNWSHELPGQTSMLQVFWSRLWLRTELGCGY